MKVTRWYIKRRPTHSSFFRDHFCYFQKFSGGFSVWVDTREKGNGFLTLIAARSVLRTLRKEDEEIRLVRVTPVKKRAKKAKG